MSARFNDNNLFICPDDTLCIIVRDVNIDISDSL